MNVSTWICLYKYESLVKKDHKIRTGIEPASSENRSVVLPLNYPIFSPVWGKDCILEHSVKNWMRLNKSEGVWGEFISNG